MVDFICGGDRQHIAEVRKLEHRSPPALKVKYEGS